MDALPGAAALARTLMVLGRTGRSGTLVVHAERADAEVGVRDGRVVAVRVETDGLERIGAILERLGAWDETRVTTPMGPGELLGGFGVRVGATSQAALSLALRKQLQARMARLFASCPLELRLRNGLGDLAAAAADEPPKSAELVMAALRERAAALPTFRIRRDLGAGLWVLTSLGRELLDEAPLWPDEAPLRPLLERGVSVDTLVSAVRGSPRALRTLYALRAVGACGPAGSRRSGYALLLRKQRQVRRAASARELLDLPPSASRDAARSALRRLAREVHPDHFGTEAPGPIAEASREVMSALFHAEESLRG